ncbi:MAG: uncharacterized protein KVP18_000235 [Porospora cf. gigantea A]|uniref:uncharacterized protein n=1 Tax=Porospora cf. gigantea A TaxID=2853593 RepID=UPI00355AC9EE|nr:MAG: hypothetical protein KVP18_000235 [Porospora cf. gigantea A]
MNLLLGVTGSHPDASAGVIKHLRAFGVDVKVVAANRSMRRCSKQVRLSTPVDSADPANVCQHLIARADVLAMLPLTAPALARVSMGICDDLPSQLIRAWDLQRPLLLFLCIDGTTWSHPSTAAHIKSVEAWGAEVHRVPPELFCQPWNEAQKLDVWNVVDVIMSRLAAEQLLLPE